MTVVTIDLAAVSDWPSFHEAFALAFGFPSFYGRNMNAWVDCLTCLDDPDAGMTSVSVPHGEVLALRLLNVAPFQSRCPDQCAALIECSAFVNHRRMETGDAPVLALSFST